jgi:hypothetical protein
MFLDDFVDTLTDGRHQFVTVGRGSSRGRDLPEVVGRQQASSVRGQNSVVTALHLVAPYPARPLWVQRAPLIELITAR